MNKSPYPRKCHHGVPFFPKQRCIDCEIEWETEMLIDAKKNVEKHRSKLHWLQREKRGEPYPG